MAGSRTQSVFGLSGTQSKPFSPGSGSGITSAGQSKQTFKGPQSFNNSGGGAVLGTKDNALDLFNDIKEGDAPDTDSKSFKKEESFINESFAPAISALDSFIAELTAAQPGLIASTEQRGEELRTRQLGEAEAGQEVLGQQRIGARQERDSLVNQARRQGAEGLQGLQAKFGGSTGTGAFAGELLQREVARSVGEQNVAFQNTIAKIDQSVAALQRNTQNILAEIDRNTQDAVAQLRASFNDNLRQLQSSRIGLESEKASAKIDLVQRFRADQQAIDARNADLKQQLMIKAAEAQGMFDKAKEDAVRDQGEVIALRRDQGLVPADPSLEFSDQKLGGPADPNILFTVEDENDPFGLGFENAAAGQSQNVTTTPGAGVPGSSI